MQTQQCALEDMHAPAVNHIPASTNPTTSSLRAPAPGQCNVGNPTFGKGRMTTLSVTDIWRRLPAPTFPCHTLRLEEYQIAPEDFILSCSTMGNLSLSHGASEQLSFFLTVLRLGDGKSNFWGEGGTSSTHKLCLDSKPRQHL